ncbi:DUF4360 domain-containing protein [Pseudobacteriovorax antillogorgiicola]|uniref:Lipoprotein n=1 Tax=Pseudobacteriovorax antillogorgiicola TaxID=1513793 RepID=A0A1Y6BPH3_9BACT|nr:DUF4360 domain-containing protein [Pseudobacteriovorax antillogorgiicola]TCS53852.1 uncharacterized protein DUF4360 [Pseudobacteriovorax antillogorgiicola]SMF21543.1 protein of unknown function [Pseudobacteriovorax antillogorgiicola]
MRFILIAWASSLLLASCGTKDSKDSNPPVNPNQCGYNSDNICSDDWFNNRDGDPFDPTDPGNQNPFPPIPGEDDDDDHDGKYGPSKSTLRLVSVESFANLKRLSNGNTMNDGRCHVRVDVNGREIRVRVQRTEMKNKQVGLGKSRSCLVNLGLRYRQGYSFSVSRIYMDLLTDLERKANGFFALDYRVQSRGSELEYRKEVYGPERTRHDLKLTPKKNRWSSCQGRENLGLSTYFETNYKNYPRGSAEWQSALQEKNYGNNRFGDLYLEEGEYRIKLKWQRCS